MSILLDTNLKVWYPIRHKIFNFISNWFVIIFFNNVEYEIESSISYWIFYKVRDLLGTKLEVWKSIFRWFLCVLLRVLPCKAQIRRVSPSPKRTEVLHRGMLVPKDNLARGVSPKEKWRTRAYRWHLATSRATTILTLLTLYITPGGCQRKWRYK